ncbi:cupin domain-containing protein [uncultured Mucilaginibacter sp.]|uniref:cupin domain-containing protein n=1 Tax=uncultured Mucilaginibacter sp. TaxID=797541 RepID=UPI0026251B73|nr:cupin domain-containing protein [uncultured Mucilaginibacter sp.]
MENSKQVPIMVGAQEGQSISVVGDTYRILVTGKQTGDAFAAIDMLIPPNGGPGPHAHANFQETFFVIEGEVEVKSEAGSYLATAGSFVVIPKGGIVHDFKNHTDKTARLLCVVVPSGMEEFFLAISKPVAFGTFLPPVTDPESMKKMKAIGEKYGQQMYPPDYLDKK